MEKNIEQFGRDRQDLLSTLFSQEEALELNLEGHENIRPLTEGLGFHHDKKQSGLNIDSYFHQKHKSSIEEKNVNYQPAFVSSHSQATNDEMSSGEVFFDGLKSFYQQDKTAPNLDLAPKSKVIKNEDFVREEYEETGALLRFSSFMIDLALLAIVDFAIVLTMFIQIFGKSSWGEWGNFISKYSIYSLPIIGLVNLFYFSFFGSSKDGTYGMQFFKIKIMDNKNEKIEFLDSALRNFIMLFFSLLLFVPVVLNYHNKIFCVKLVKRKTRQNEKNLKRGPRFPRKK